jgi:hypothetical protein
MALIDSVNDDTPSEFEAEEQKQAQAAQAQEQQPEKPKLPSKYEGKTIEEVVQMHQEAEKLIGRQAQEVGEVRKLADQLLKQNLAAKQPEPPQEKEVDFFEDPQKAIERAVANHPSVLAAQQAAAQMKAMQTQQQLAAKHPDFTDVIRDGEFLEWVKASPIRLNMFALADSQYDFAAADELLSTFKQIRSIKTKETVETGQKSLNKNLQAAAVDVGGTGESSKKVYRRADLIRLRMTDPARYEALQPEIMAAYAEGRVK